MSEYNERERFPIRFPFVDEPGRVLEPSEHDDEWRLEPSPYEEYEDEVEPQSEMKGSRSGFKGAYVGKPPTGGQWPPFGPIPDFGGRLPGYRSFRHFDPSRPEFKTVPGRVIPEDANLWGVIIPKEYVSTVARMTDALNAHRATNGPLRLTIVSGRPSKAAPSTTSFKDAVDYVFAFHVPLFLLDRACAIMGDIHNFGTHRSNDLFVRNFQHVEKLAIHLCHRHAIKHGPGDSHLGLAFGFMSPSTFEFDRRSGLDKILGGTIGQAYTKVLTGLLTGDPRSTPMTGLNFLIGSEVPAMTTYDLYFKFKTSVVQLPVHLV